MPPPYLQRQYERNQQKCYTGACDNEQQFFHFCLLILDYSDVLGYNIITICAGREGYVVFQPWEDV